MPPAAPPSRRASPAPTRCCSSSAPMSPLLAVVMSAKMDLPRRRSTSRRSSIDPIRAADPSPPLPQPQPRARRSRRQSTPHRRSSQPPLPPPTVDADLDADPRPARRSAGAGERSTRASRRSVGRRRSVTRPRLLTPPSELRPPYPAVEAAQRGRSDADASADDRRAAAASIAVDPVGRADRPSSSRAPAPDRALALSARRPRTAARSSSTVITLRFELDG